MSLLRLFDANYHRRALRTTLRSRLGARIDDLPHSFDTTGLLEVAATETRRDGARRSDTLDLIERTGIVMGLADRDRDALTMFERGLVSSDGPARQARFRYLLAVQHHHRRGHVRLALDELMRASDLAGGHRPLRGEILLALVRAARELGDHGRAEWALADLRQRPIKRLVPHVHLAAASLRMAQARGGDARREASRAEREFAARGEDLGVLTARASQATILLAEGRDADARRVIEAVIAERERSYDLTRLPKSYNNLAVACRRLGDPESAIEALAKAIRTNQALGRSRLLSANYHNLGRAMADAGDAEAALRALGKAMSLAKETRAAEREFDAIIDALDILERLGGEEGNGARLRTSDGAGARAELVARGRALVEEAGHHLSKDGLLAFVRAALPAVPLPDEHPMGVSAFDALGAGAADRLDAVLTRVRPVIGRDDLVRRLSRTFRYRGAPRSEVLGRFLWLFTGDWLRNVDYASEFAFTHDVSKRQLRALCHDGVLEMLGTRKTARYRLTLGAER